MRDKRYIVAIDQGTTSSRAVVYDLDGNEVASAAEDLAVNFPQDGWVEQDANEIWRTQSAALESATADISAADIACIGISNQRETTIAWDRASGEPLAPAIVWQCRRSAGICEQLKDERLGTEALDQVIPEVTGLVIDAYFSATKMRWMLAEVPGLREKINAGTAIFGTVDSWIVYQLARAKGKHVFATDTSNASRTMLFDLSQMRWSEKLLQHFELSPAALCKVQRSNSSFCEALIRGETVPVSAVLGDQQAALFGQGCVEPGQTKCTFGTGAFMLSNCGKQIVRSGAGMLTTVAWSIASGKDVETNYALEGSVFVAGSLIQWLRDKLGLISSAADSERLALEVPDNGGVTIVPAFVGLGAPHWRADVRGTISGLTRDSSRAHIVRAALESVAHQLADLLVAPEFSAGAGVKCLKVDGGMSNNALFCQMLSDYTGLNVEVSANTEATARGAALMSGIGAGLFQSVQQAQASWSRKPARTFVPKIANEVRNAAREQWQTAIKRLLAH